MKKLIIFMALLPLLTINLFSPIIYVFASDHYARIETTTPIYKSANTLDNFDNIYCLAEETYFVKILGDYNNFYRIHYNNINGYIKKSDVKEVSTTPSTPYPTNINLTIGSNCNLRSTPTTKSTINNIVCTLYSNTSDVVFIGRINGEECIDFGGNLWYYVNYNGNYGYVYNNYVKSITTIYRNTEPFEYAKLTNNVIVNPITHTPSLIIIFILFIPIVAILIILYIPFKPKTKHKPKKPHKPLDRY